MKKSILGNEQTRNFCCVMCAVGATMATKPQNFVGLLLGVTLGCSLILCLLGLGIETTLFV